MLFNIIPYSSVGVLSSPCSTVRCILFSHIFNSLLIVFMFLILFRMTIFDYHISGKSSFSVSLRIIFFVKKLYIG